MIIFVGLGFVLIEHLLHRDLHIVAALAQEDMPALAAGVPLHDDRQGELREDPLYYLTGRGRPGVTAVYLRTLRVHEAHRLRHGDGLTQKLVAKLLVAADLRGCAVVERRGGAGGIISPAG